MSDPVTLGPVCRPVLEALAAQQDGITITGLAGLLGLSRASVDQAVRVLDRRGCVTILGRQPMAGRSAAVYAASTTGLAALQAAKETAQ